MCTWRTQDAHYIIVFLEITDLDSETYISYLLFGTHKRHARANGVKVDKVFNFDTNQNNDMRAILTVKEMVHPKMTNLSSFTHPQALSNLYEFPSAVGHRIRYFEERWQPNSRWQPSTSTVFPVKVNGHHQPLGHQHSPKHPPPRPRNSYRFRTIWGYVNYENFHFWVKHPFNF